MLTFKDIAILVLVGGIGFGLMIWRDQGHACEGAPIQGGVIKKLLTRSAPVPGGSGTGA